MANTPISGPGTTPNTAVIASTIFPIGGSGKPTTTAALISAYVLASPTLTGTTAAPTVTAGDNSTKIATTAWVVSNTQSRLPVLGTIITDTFIRANGAIGANWSVAGSATFNIVSNSLSVSSASGSLVLTNYASYTAYGKSNLENPQISYTITVGTINSTSFGIGASFQYFNGNGGIQCCIDLHTGSTGKITYYAANSTTVPTFNPSNIGVASPNGLTITAGDVLRVVHKRIDHRIITTVTNTSVTPNTTNSYEFDGGYSFSGNTAGFQATYYGLLALGGTHTVNNFVVSSNDYKGLDYLTLGDSMGWIYCNSKNEIWVNRLGLQSDLTFGLNTGSSNQIQDINTVEVGLLNPKNIIVHLGYNNVDGDANATTTRTRFATLATALGALVTTNAPSGYSVANGNLWFVTVPPSTAPTNASLIPTINGNLYTDYAAGLIRTYDVLANGAAGRYTTDGTVGDGIHGGPEWNRIVANVVSTTIPAITARTKGIEDQYNLKYDYTGNVLITPRGSSGRAVLQGNAITPRYPLTIYQNSTLGAQLCIAANASDGGLLLQSSGVANGNIGAGAHYNYVLGGFEAKAAAVSLMFMNTSFVTFSANTGLTPGATYTPTLRMYYDEAIIKLANPTFIGGNTTPTAKLHLAAGIAAASGGPLKFTSGTNLTTAEAGVMEYNGTNLFFTRAGTVRENILVAIDNVAAPSTTATPAFTAYYGGNTNALGDPNRWLSVNVLGATYKIPLYN